MSWKFWTGSIAVNFSCILFFAAAQCEVKKIHVEQVIAYSKYANTQIFLKAVSLKDMMKSKLEAFLGGNIILLKISKY